MQMQTMAAQRSQALATVVLVETAILNLARARSEIGTYATDTWPALHRVQRVRATYKYSVGTAVNGSIMLRHAQSTVYMLSASPTAFD